MCVLFDPKYGTRVYIYILKDDDVIKVGGLDANGKLVMCVENRYPIRAPTVCLIASMFYYQHHIFKRILKERGSSQLQTLRTTRQHKQILTFICGAVA